MFRFPSRCPSVIIEFPFGALIGPGIFVFLLFVFVIDQGIGAFSNAFSHGPFFAGSLDFFGPGQIFSHGAFENAFSHEPGLILHGAGLHRTIGSALATGALKNMAIPATAATVILPNIFFFRFF
jgi:hypothetical protein